MAITFTQEKKKQRYLILVLASLVFLTVFFVWLSLTSAPEEPLPPPAFTPPKVKIDFETLKGQDIKDLVPFQGIEEFKGELGRDNPFILY